MADNGHIPLNVPILGGPKKLGVAKVGGDISGIARRLDAAGLFEVDLIQGSQGPMPSSRRESYMDAEELLAAIREIVREELAALKV